MSIRKVIIFDSGVGGLSIWQEVRQRLTDIECHYLFDNAYFPYGELAESTLVKRVCALVPALAAQIQADAVVIACNTASTAVLDPLRELLTIPVVGVVPAIKPAAAMSQTRHIAVLATPATVERAYTQQLVKDFASDCQVTLVGSSTLVQLAESYLQTSTIDQELLTQELAAISAKPKVDTIVLGCTHFPLIKEAVANALHPKLQIVDSGEAIARQLQRVLPFVQHSSSEVQHEYYFTLEEKAVDGFMDVFGRLGFEKGQAFLAPYH